MSVYVLAGERSAYRWSVEIPTRLLFALGMLLLCALAVKVTVKIYITQYGYQLAAEREYTLELDRQMRELKLEKNILLRPDNLSKMARQRLGLREADPSKTRKIIFKNVGG